MQDLSPAYLTALAQQTGFLAAFLGGFAATILMMLLQIERDRRVMIFAIGFAALSAILLIVAVGASSAMIATLHPEAPVPPSQAMIGYQRVLMGLCFMLGMQTLMIAIGISGWLRSRATGWTTGILAALGVVLTLSLTVQIG